MFYRVEDLLQVLLNNLRWTALEKQTFLPGQTPQEKPNPMHTSLPLPPHPLIYTYIYIYIKQTTACHCRLFLKFHLPHHYTVSQPQRTRREQNPRGDTRRRIHGCFLHLQLWGPPLSDPLLLPPSPPACLPGRVWSRGQGRLDHPQEERGGNVQPVGFQ